jgi:hypothetical protein
METMTKEFFIQMGHEQAQSDLNNHEITGPDPIHHERFKHVPEHLREEFHTAYVDAFLRTLDMPLV